MSTICSSLNLDKEQIAKVNSKIIENYWKESKIKSVEDVNNECRANCRRKLIGSVDEKNSHINYFIKIPDHDIFLSYCWTDPKNKDRAKNIHDALGTKGKKVWLDQNEFNTNQTASDAMIEGINKSGIFMCLLDNHYGLSENCFNEFHWAISSKKSLISFGLGSYDDLLEKIKF